RARGSDRQADAAGDVAGRQSPVQLLPNAVAGATPDAGLRAAPFQPGKQGLWMLYQRMAPVIVTRWAFLLPSCPSAVRRNVQAGRVALVERHATQVQGGGRVFAGQEYADGAWHVLGVGGSQQLPVPAAIAADVEAGAPGAIRR